MHRVTRILMSNLLAHLQENFKVELDRADGVRQLELVQHAGVQDTKDADSVVLPAEVDLDGCRVAGEEGLVWGELALNVYIDVEFGAVARARLTIDLFYPVALQRGILEPIFPCHEL